MEAPVARAVECAPYLQRLILEDPDPTSPLYVPKAPPRSYETLSKAVEKGIYVDNEAAPKTLEASRGINMRDSRAVRSKLTKEQKEESKARKQTAQYDRRREFAGDDPFSMGGDPFGREGSSPFGGGGGPSHFGGGEGPSPFGGGGGWDPDGDPFGDMEEPQYNNFYQDARQYSMGKKIPNQDYAGNEVDGEPDMIDEMENVEEGEEEMNREDFKQSVPIYEEGDYDLREEARRLRREDDLRAMEYEKAEAEGTGNDRPAAEGTSGEQPVAEGTAADGTGTELQEGGGIRARRKLKEEFMRDREELEKRMNAQGDSIYRRGDQPPPPREVPPGAGIDEPPPRPRSRIMSGQEIKQQMAMQKLAAAALKAIAKGGKGKKGGGKVKVMFM